MYYNIEGSQSLSALIIEANMKLCIIILKVLNNNNNKDKAQSYVLPNLT